MKPAPAPMQISSLRSIAPKLPPGLLFGGDYNPEQWPSEVWVEDVRLMREAGVNLVSVGVFSWAKLQPRADVFTFAWLDQILDLLWQHGVSTCLATATASPPPWFSLAHPESLPVDVNGQRLSIGARQHYCPNSQAYRLAGATLIRELAKRYASHPGVALWHVNNEVGCHIQECYCEACAAEFRRWLQTRHRTLDGLNDAWGTAFWSQGYGDWEEIQLPRKAPTFHNPGQVLDYRRFMSDSLAGVLRNEVAALRSVVPDAKVTTNGMNFWRGTDYWDWYRDFDIAAWDSYPDPSGGLDEVRATAFGHDLYRSLRGGQPFILMEQATTQVNWRSANRLKAPGQMRALSYQALARGADGVMFFQWRQSKAGAEKFHSAMVPHVGPDSRAHREVKALGAELGKLSALAGARTRASIGLVVSWENRWALELDSKPTKFDYQEIVAHFHGAIWDLNLPIDFVHPDAPFDGYDVIVAPALYQMTRVQADCLRQFVQRGGLLIMSYFSGIADERDHIWLGGYPALLSDVIGATVDEWQPISSDSTHAIRMDGQSAAVSCTKFAELLTLHGAIALATHDKDFFAGSPAITYHRFEQGHACYIGTHPNRSSLSALLGTLLGPRGHVAPVIAGAGVEVATRVGEGGVFLFVINHEPITARVDFGDWSGNDITSGEACNADTMIPPFGVRVIHRPSSLKSRVPLCHLVGAEKDAGGVVS